MASNAPMKDKDFGQPTTTEKAKEAAHSMADKAKEAGAAVMDKAKDLASQAGDKAKQAASAAGDAADRWTSSAGSGIKHLGEKLEEKGPREGMLGSAKHAVASTLEESGRYIEQEGLSGMMDDVSNVIRRHPLPAVLVGIGVGFLIGRTLGS